MYSEELHYLRELARKHIMSPEVSVMLIKISEDIMKKLNLPVKMKPEVLCLVATTIAKESANLLEQEGLV
jgi:hypothetical protein